MNPINNLLIYCSCFIPNSEDSWEHTASLFDKLSYAEFGNIQSIFDKESKNYSMLGVLFHQDFASDIDSTADRYTLFTESLKEKLTKSNGEVFIAYSSYKPMNIIEITKKKDPLDQVIIDFKNSMYDLAKNFKSFYFIDLDVIFNEKGHENIFDARNWYYAKMRLSLSGFKLMDKVVSQIIEKTRKANKKLLVLDCDNTLWGGVLGEVGFDKINIGNDGIGNAFIDFQKEIVRQNKQGILLAICSKNNEVDVLDVFENHSSMALNNSHIVAFKVNWKEKHKNIKEISEELSINLDSFVFWDDDPLERQKVKNFLPEVEVIEPPLEIEKWPKLLFENVSFSNILLTTEDKNRSDQYKSREEFIQRQKVAKDKFTFLKEVKIKPKLFDVSSDHISRAAQLTQKTNQFNFRTIRYTENELSKLISNERFIIKMCSVSDIFGDHGNVGLLILEKKNKNLFFLGSFILSCRILGRELESWILQSVLIQIKSMDVDFLEIEYLQTHKNKPAKNFLDNFKQFINTGSSNSDGGKNVNFILPSDHIYIDISDVY